MEEFDACGDEYSQLGVMAIFQVSVSTENEKRY